ncbi:MAG: glutamyl-tRNA amidotransferase [Pelagibacteraceae bacterium]|nr:glutamyl-tRNA amidotransferase [Pelagibacteraceae bacterium]OUV89351.1 MAG: glutamyl-tRNA amidotransferase [Pelagibacteraceae bacterium TMED146]|tara:strand:- start:3023 stop:3481 length:459 start_codon:yes stop_codon:yes gene_type:complete
MTIFENVNNALSESLKSKQSDRVLTLRAIVSAKKDKEIEKRTQDKKDVTDEDMISILNKMLKQRKESVEMYQKASRQDLVDKENTEIKIIEEFLPQQLSQEEVQKVCNEVISNVGASSLKDMGKVMAVLKEKYLGKMDFSLAGKILKDKLKG